MNQNCNYNVTIVNSLLSIPPISRFVFQTLRSLANDLNAIQISQERVAQATGLCRATINRHTQVLENAGLIAITRFPTNSRIPNVYHFDCVTEADTSVCFSDSEIDTHSVIEDTHSLDSFKQQTEMCDAELHSPDEKSAASPQQADIVVAYLENRAGQASDLPRFKGIAPEMMAELIEKYGAMRVKAAIRYTKRQTNLFKPTGFLIRAIEGCVRGLDLSEDEREIRLERNPGSRYTSGKYAAWVSS